MIAVGKLREDTFHLKLHASPNGRVVGFMNKGDEFVLADELPKKNVGGKLEWQRGTVTSKGTTYSDVYVARERLDLVWQHLPPSRPTEPPWDDKFPPDVPRPDIHDSPLPAPERKAWWRFRLFRSWTEAPGLLICIILTLSLAWCSLAPAQPSWCSGNCGGRSQLWTLYVFERGGSSGFVQQKLSGHDTVESCEAHVNETYFHLDQVVSARCVPLTNAIGHSKWIKEGPTHVGYY